MVMSLRREGAVANTDNNIHTGGGGGAGPFSPWQELTYQPPVSLWVAMAPHEAQNVYPPWDQTWTVRVQLEDAGDVETHNQVLTGPITYDDGSALSLLSFPTHPAEQKANISTWSSHIAQNGQPVESVNIPPLTGNDPMPPITSPDFDLMVSTNQFLQRRTDHWSNELARWGVTSDRSENIKIHLQNAISGDPSMKIITTRAMMDKPNALLFASIDWMALRAALGFGEQLIGIDRAVQLLNLPTGRRGSVMRNVSTAVLKLLNVDEGEAARAAHLAAEAKGVDMGLGPWSMLIADENKSE